LTWLFLKEKEAREQQARLRQDAEQARLNETRLRRQAELREKLTQAAYLVNQQRFSEADRLLEGVRPEQPTVEGAAALRSLGEWHAFQNHWPQATERFNVLLDVNQFESWDVSTLDFLSCGTALVESGNREGFWQFCDMAIARFNGTTNPVAAERILKICLLLPPPEETLRAVAPLAKVAEEASRNMPAKGSADETFFAAWRAISLALLDYRRGNYARSVEWCERCLAFTEYNPARVATAKVIMAMARHQLNQAEESRAALVPATKSIEDEFRAGLVRGSREDGFWFDWVFARVLLRELTGSNGGAAK
jgi:tetratricopeptide (TPR) repeat protein